MTKRFPPAGEIPDDQTTAAWAMAGLLRGWQAAGGAILVGWTALSLILLNLLLGTPSVRVAAIQPIG